MRSYVQERLEELARKNKEEMSWLMFLAMWEDLSQAAEYQRRIDLNMEKFNAIRAKYVKKGRKPGYSPKAKEQQAA